MSQCDKNFKPDISGLNQLDVAVLLEMYINLNGMINFGTKEEKNRAKEEIERLEPFIHKHVNTAAFERAKCELGFDPDENRPTEPLNISK